MIRQKQNFLSARRLLLIASETFFDSSVVPLLLVIVKLGERTGQLWRNNSRRVRTQEKNSGDAVRRLGTIIQSIFCAQSGASIRLTVWNGPVRVGTQGLFRLYLKTFVTLFLPARLTAPGSPRMLTHLCDPSDQRRLLVEGLADCATATQGNLGYEK